ncbi:(S)-2-haloacid dehalogenase [Streptomyces sp. YIM 130001]|uniref:haloacid dehalogenase type II n=1 Tax=Streptomyces sp. YIM 130001 TaxID=2259644 RepID=UPI000E6466CE|nr:haloacid dehalogenase type II [Streptomyces sp. YIM 130001]RII14772.1 (S)-2-haloacid dehalogenase [Streptomyces sp. YIM 130001]
MATVGGIEAVVLDILGTMVDEPGGLRTALHEALPTADDERLDRLLTRWQEYVEREQQRIASGERPYADSEFIDREAARHVTGRADVTDPDVVERLACAAQRLDPWPDSAAGLVRLARAFPVLGLSNAARSTLLRLNAHAGLSWHLALSAQDARAYKPAPEVYRLALDAVGRPPERVLMVAAHAWDLRAAQALGMRTAYVRRPVGDPPTSADTFDLYAQNLDDLVTALTADGATAGADLN